MMGGVYYNVDAVFFDDARRRASVGDGRREEQRLVAEISTLCKKQAGRQAGRTRRRACFGFFLNWSTLLLPTSSRSVCLRLRLRLRLGDVSLRFVSCTEAKWMGTADLYRTSLGSLYLRLFTVTCLSNMRVCRHVCVCVLWCWIVSRLYVVCVSCCCCLVQRVLGSQSGVGVIL